MEELNLEDIIVTNPYLRTQTDIESLKKSIETVGLINPLTVNKDNELLAGGRRYQALKELGFKNVPVQRVERNELEQELISIDENLVRTPLSKIELEQCLNRGRELYEQLNPTAPKIETKAKDLTPAEKKAEKEEEERDTTSFAAVTSEKTGLSKSVIKNAIKRDASSSPKVKEARSKGDISASQVNEIIKLDQEEQDAILPHVKDKTVKEVRKIVERARAEGIEEAIQASAEEEVLPREFKELMAMVKRCNKQFSKIIIENMDVDHPEMDKITEQVQNLRAHVGDYLELYNGEAAFTPPSSSSSTYEESASMQ